MNYNQNSEKSGGKYILFQSYISEKKYIPFFCFFTGSFYSLVYLLSDAVSTVVWVRPFLREKHCSFSSFVFFHSLKIVLRTLQFNFAVFVGRGGRLSFRNYTELEYILQNGVSSSSMGGVTAFRLYNQYEESSISKLELDLYCLLQSNENEYPHYFTSECSSRVSNIKKEADNVLHFSAEMKGNWMVQRLVIGYVTFHL